MKKKCPMCFYFIGIWILLSNEIIAISTEWSISVLNVTAKSLIKLTKWVAHNWDCASVCYSDTSSPSSLAFVREIHRWPVNFPHNGPVTRKMFPFDDVIMHRVTLILMDRLNDNIQINDMLTEQPSDGRLNIKMSSYQYRDPHVIDKTISGPFYL